VVRVPEAHEVEQNDPVILGEGRPYVAPHALIAAEAVREEHRPRIARAVLDHVVASQNLHAVS
jgi:hypothetical protein